MGKRGRPFTEAQINELGKPNAATLMNPDSRQTSSSKAYNQLALKPVQRCIHSGRINRRITTFAIGLVCLQVAILFPTAADLEMFPKHLRDLLLAVNEATGDVQGMSYTDTWDLMCAVCAFMTGWSTKKVLKFWLVLTQQRSRIHGDEMGEDDLDAMCDQYLERYASVLPNSGEWTAKSTDDDMDAMGDIMEALEDKLRDTTRPDPRAVEDGGGVIVPVEVRRPAGPQRGRHKSKKERRRDQVKRKSKKDKKSVKSKKQDKLDKLRQLLKEQMDIDSDSSSSSSQPTSSSASSVDSAMAIQMRKELEHERARKREKKKEKNAPESKKRKKSEREADPAQEAAAREAAAKEAADVEAKRAAREAKKAERQRKAEERQKDKDKSDSMRECNKAAEELDELSKAVSARASKVPSPASRANTSGRPQQKFQSSGKTPAGDKRPSKTESTTAAGGDSQVLGGASDGQTRVSDSTEFKKKIEEHLFGKVDADGDVEMRDVSEADIWRFPSGRFGGIRTSKTTIRREKPEVEAKPESPAAAAAPVVEEKPPTPAKTEVKEQPKVTLEDVVMGQCPLARGSSDPAPTTDEVIHATVLQNMAQEAREAEKQLSPGEKRREAEKHFFSPDNESQEAAKSVGSKSTPNKSPRGNYEVDSLFDEGSVSGEEGGKEEKGYPSDGTESDDIIIRD
eukprot:g18688.t1